MNVKTQDQAATLGLLECSELLGHLDKEHLERLSGVCRRFSYPAGTVVFREGDEAAKMYVLQDGRVALDIDIPVVSDRPAVPIAADMVGPTDCFGWSSFLEPRTYRATARCITTCTGAVIDADALKEVMADDAALGYKLMSRLAQTVADYLGHTRLRLITQVVRLLDRKDW